MMWIPGGFSVRPLLAGLLLFFAAWMLPLSLSAQDVLEPKTVRAIEVQYVGAATVARERILSNMSTKVGDAFSQAAIEQDVKNLYGSGDVENIRILSEPSGSDGVKVIVVVQTRAALSEVVFLGNSQIETSRLQREVELKVGNTVDEIAVQDGQRAIEKLYQKKGFPDIDVLYSIKAAAQTGYSRVVYTINEGEKASLRDILFRGNTVFSERELRNEMELKEKSLWAAFTKSGRIDNNTLEDDIERLESHYRNHGYLNARVTDVEKVRVGGEKVDLVITMAEGMRYDVASVSIAGLQAFSEAELLPTLRQTPGAAYSAELVEQDVQTVKDYYGSRGYAEARVSPQITQADQDTLNVIYNVYEGGKFYIEKINIDGNTKTQDKVIRRELKVAPGDEFNTVRLAASRNVLENLGYFSTVEFLPTDTGTEGFKNIDITVAEKSTGTVNFGAGFSSIDNLVGFVDVTQSNFDVSNWPRFTGGGQKFRAGLKFGTERRDFIMSLTEPWFLDRKLSLGGEVFYRDIFFLSDDYDQRNYGGAISLRKPLGEYSSLRGEYRIQDIRISDIPSSASEEIAAEEGDFLQSKLGVDFLRDTRDSVFLPRDGMRLNAGTYLSGEFLGGDVDTYGVNTGAVKYFSLPFDTIFSIEGNLEVVDELSGDQPPIFERVFLGGANNLRGFDFREVGPKDEFGEPLGGQTAAYLTAEYTFPLIKRVRGALFYDWGFVNEDDFDFSTSEANSNFGVGLRLFLPVGPIRLDFGIPVQSDEFNDSDGKFNFNIGYQF